MEGETHGAETQGAEQGNAPQASGQQAPQSEELTTEQSVSGRAVEGAPSAVQSDAVSGSGSGDSGQGEADWQARLDAKDAEMADMKVGYELRLAGARNVKAAKALLGEYEGDITKLKSSEPWLFVPEQMVGANGATTSPNKTQGKTGLPNQGVALDEGKELKRWRQIAGLED